MGIASFLLGESNPFAQWVNQNQNTLDAIGTGIGSGQNIQSGLSNALQLSQGARQLDRADAEKRKAEKLAETQANTTQNWLQANHPDLAQMVQAGMPVSEAWSTAMQRMQPEAGLEPTANMRDFEYSLQNPGYAEFLNPPKDTATNMPASVQEYQFAVDQGFKGSITDYEREKKSAGRAPMSPTTQKELFEADDAAKAGDYVLSALDEAQQLNDAAYDGPMADIRGDATALFGDQAGVATSRLKNVTTELALSQLKTIFGSMPTEGERKILLELQGSVNQPKQVRAAIFKRAKEMALRRIADNQAKAGALRSGAYFEEGYGAAPGNTTSTGVQWSVEP